MKRFGLILALVGILGTAGISAAYEHQEKWEGHRGPMRGEVPPEMKALKEKYHARKEQLRQECQQKMRAIEEEEHNEMTSALNAAHERRMKEREERYQKHMPSSP